MSTISNLSNIELVSLSKELSVMANMDIPVNHKKSELLKSLWQKGNFHDNFSYIRVYCTSEIIYRINNDLF